mgnify:CR=1 FL=1
MKTSEDIKDIASALHLAQGHMTGAKKDSKNPFFKSNYSDLTSVMQAISKPFFDNGLSFVQGAEFQEGMIAIVTRLMHTSGQWIESTTLLPAIKNDPQAYGSAITYGKRYSLQALVGVPSVDDDGQFASAGVLEERKLVKIELTPSSKNWDSAIEAYKREGSLDKVKERVTISPENEQLIMDLAEQKNVA